MNMKMFLHYDENNCPTKCNLCGSYNLYEETTDTIQGHISEANVVCDLCQQTVGYYAYGYYDPVYAYAYGLKEILQYFIRCLIK